MMEIQKKTEPPLCIMLSLILSSIFLYTTNADTLFMTNNSHVADPKTYDYIVSFDTTTNKVTAWPTTIPSADIIVSGGIACNYSDGSIMYYATWVNFGTGSNTGVFAFNVTSGKVTSYASSENNYHIFQCTSTPTQLLAVSNDFSTPPTFYLEEITVQGTSVGSKQIGTFGSNKKENVDGMDTIFSWNPSANELWAAFANSDDKPTSGTLVIMSTTDGSIKKQYEYPRNAGEPYFTLPQTLKGSAFKGAQKKGEPDMEWSTLTIDGSDLDISDPIAADWLWSGGQPYTFCGNTGYVVDDQSVLITSFDIQTGKKGKVYNMQTNGVKPAHIGAIACL
eukprot:374324_1